MKEIDPKSADDLDEQTIDVLQGLIVGLESLDELWGGIEELLRQDCRTDGLKQRSPFRQIRAIVRCAQKQDAVC